MKKFALLLLLIAAILPAQDWDQTLKDFSTLKVKGTIDEEFPLNIGNMSMSLTGNCTQVVAGSTPVGWLFSGKGRMLYTIKDPISLSAAKTNLKENGSYTLTSDNQLSDTFTEGFFLIYPFPDKPPFPKDAPAADSPKLAEYADLMRRMGFPGMETSFAPCLFNHYKNPMVMIFLKGAKEKNLFYAMDGNETMEESLITYKTARGDTQFEQMTALVTQPVGYDWTKRRIHPLYQTHVDIELVSTDNIALKEKAAIQFTTTVDGLRCMTLSLLNGTSREYSFWDKRSSPFTCKKITDAEGKAVPFIHKYDQILLLLNTPMVKGKPFTLTFESEGGLLKNFFGDAYMVLGNMAWYPTIDFYAQASSFHSIVKVKAPYVPISCGKLIKEWKEGDLNCQESDEPEPLSFPFVIVGEFKTQEFKKDPYLLRVHSYVQMKQSGGEKLGKNGLAVLDFYSHGMVPYAYRELDVVEIPYYRNFFWQSPAGIVEITSEGMNPIGNGDEDDLDNVMRRYASLGVNSRYAHELGHQWYGNLVSWASEQDGWLSESFAEYLSFMFMMTQDKKKAREQFNLWEVATKELKDRGTIANAPLLSYDEAESDRTRLYYSKGPLVLHALRQEIGDDVFMTVLKKFAEQCGKKKIKATTDDFIQFVSIFAKKDFHPWFDKYFYGGEMPTYKKP